MKTTNEEGKPFLPPYQGQNQNYQQQNADYNQYQNPPIQTTYGNQEMSQIHRQGSVRLSEYESQRRQNAFKRSIDSAVQEMTFDFIACITITIFLIIDKEDLCNYDIKTWLMVVDIYYAVDFFILIFQLKYLNKYRKENLCIILLKLLFSFGLIGWLIYGNLIYYAQENRCIDEAYGLNLIMFLVILFGYYEMLKCCCMSTCVCCMLPLMFFAARGPQQPSWMPAPPNFIQNLARTRFDRTNNTACEQCAICLMDFVETDEITPLPCDPKHYFHPECIENWLKNNNNCPLCKKSITQEALNAQKQMIIEQQR